VSAKSGVQLAKNFYGFTVLTGDFDNDGWPDFYVACDSVPSLYFHNKHDGTFEELGLVSGLSLNEDGREQAGMGVSTADYDRDGWLDIFKTNFSNDTPTLYRNNRDGSFVDVTRVAGLANRTSFLGWGTAFLDIDNDGWPDILSVNGHVYPEVDSSKAGETYHQSRLVYWNRRDGQFYDMSDQSGSGIKEAHASRGLAIGDLDNDGRLDAVVTTNDGSVHVLHNETATRNHWILLKLVGHKSNRDAIGAEVTLVTNSGPQYATVSTAGSYLSASDKRVHFGMGKEGVAQRIEIRWPSGIRQTLKDVAADQVLQVDELDTPTVPPKP